MRKFDLNILETAKTEVLHVVDKQMIRAGKQFPSGWTKGGTYEMIGCDNWMSAFWTGMLWLAYEWTGEMKYRELAEKHLEIFRWRIEERHEVWNHDLGFLYSLSCVAAYKLTGNEKAKETALMAADYLYENFYVQKGTPHINAWADKHNMDNSTSFLIIDCLMNIPLLHWAYNISGEEKYKKAASAHAETTAELIFREDNSTYHKYHFDMETGEALYGATAQGYSDESCWSRGQAWGIYGFALAYANTGNKRYIDCFKRATDYFISKLPTDYVPYWDFTFMDGDEPRDSSAAVIAACGILEAAKLCPEDVKIQGYLDICLKITESLLQNYMLSADGDEEGLLSGGTAFKAQGDFDHALIFGDYYFMELLTRLTMNWERYC